MNEFMIAPPGRIHQELVQQIEPYDQKYIADHKEPVKYIRHRLRIFKSG